LVREILEEQRAISGSQTVFLCGRVDYEERSPLLPASGHMPALFCWMGNVTAQLFTAEGTYITLGDRDNDRNRWSTVHGCLGALSLLILEPKVIDRLIIYTDGLDAIEQELAHLSEHELQARTQQLLQSPTNDDMTVLDLQWLHTPVEKECVP
jgi:hypothetical protein